MICPGVRTGLAGPSGITYAFEASGGAGWELTRSSCRMQ